MVTTQVIVLNGGSSSGKSGIARCLQAVLPDPWLAVGVDMLIQPRRDIPGTAAEFDAVLARHFSGQHARLRLGDVPDALAGLGRSPQAQARPRVFRRPPVPGGTVAPHMISGSGHSRQHECLPAMSSTRYRGTPSPTRHERAGVMPAERYRRCRRRVASAGARARGYVSTQARTGYGPGVRRLRQAPTPGGPAHSGGPPCCAAPQPA